MRNYIVSGYVLCASYWMLKIIFGDHSGYQTHEWIIGGLLAVILIAGPIGSVIGGVIGWLLLREQRNAISVQERSRTD